MKTKRIIGEAGLNAKTLTVRWAMPSPPISPTIWHRWDRLPDPSTDDGKVAIELGWPEMTVAVLRAAFQKKLSRATGWEIGRGLADAASFAQAAVVYKRGVAVRREGEVPPIAKQANGTYDIVMHPSGDVPPSEILGGDEFAVIDAGCAVHWPALARRANSLVLAPHEHEKSLTTVARIVAASQGRPIVVVGGGILGDVAGFAASLGNATVRFVPTTLLAMVDACVGGKTGVNFPPFGKNLVGAFHFPIAVDVWPGWLRTLPARHFAAGAAECLKHAFLAGNQILAQELAAAFLSKDLLKLVDLFPAVIGYKVDVVAEDPAERGRRAILNFGHTLGHALEALSQAETKGDATLLHGEAVGIGMVFALVMSRRVSTLTRIESDAMIEMLRRCGLVPDRAALAPRLGGLDLHDKNTFKRLSDLIVNDKKNLGGAASEWILLGKGGKIARGNGAHWTTSVFVSEIASAWPEFLKVLNPDF